MAKNKMYSEPVKDYTPVAGEGVPRRHVALQGKSPIKELPGAHNIHDIFQMGLKKAKNGAGDFLGHRPMNNGVAGPYVWQSYGEVLSRMTDFGSALHNVSGLKFTAPVGLFSVNRPEWVIAEHACYKYGFTTVPLYDTLGMEAVEYIVEQVEMALVVCTQDKVKTILDLHAKGSGLEWVILMDGSEDLGHLNLKFEDNVATFTDPDNGKSLKFVTFAAFEQKGAGNRMKEPKEPVNEEHIATICYTSGTTGKPKGVILTHQTFVSECAGLQLLAKGKYFVTLGPEDIHISYLPLAHVFERLIECYLAFNGSKIGFYTGDTLKLLDDVAALRPTIFASVPRLFNRIYDKVNAGVKAKGGISAFLFNTAYNSKKGALANGNVTHWLWDRLVFGAVRARLGGRVKAMVSGSAPISAEVMDFLRICFSADVYEGYGQTETCAAASLTCNGDTTGGHIGPPVPCCEVKLVDVPDMNYLSTDKPFPRGEIYLRGNQTLRGYYRNEEKTKEALTDDGYVRTGDVGMWDKQGRLVIIDRVKQLFKLSQGEYVAPEKVENATRLFDQHSLTQMLYVHGDSLESCLVGVAVPDPETFVPWGRKITGNKTAELEDLCKDEQINASLVKQLQAAGKKAGLKGFELVRALHVEPEPFSVENDLLTPTFKTKRNNVHAKYKAEIAEMYARMK